MKVAITGASGHIGSCICQYLVDAGHDVRVLIHKNKMGIDGLPVEIMHGDVLSLPAMEQLLDNADAVIHMAAIVSIRSKNKHLVSVNTEGTRIALEAALSTKLRRFIHFSTIHTFNSHPLHIPLDESREQVSASPYDYDNSKLQSEHLVEDAGKAGLETITLHPTAVMGPFDYKPSSLGNAIIRFYKGENPALIPGGYDWVDVRDVAAAAINALHGGTPGEKYILSGNWVSIEELATQIERLGGAPKPSFTAPYWLAKLGAPVLNMAATISGKEPIYTRLSLDTVKNGHTMISSSKAIKHLGHKARPFSETLSDTLEWFKSLQMIK
jgi:dihydroflavonol-4-reductase